ncbi:hypothetical protein, partial [Nonomuraea rhodomycinica]
IERAVALGVPVLVGVGGHPATDDSPDGSPGGSTGSPAGEGVERTAEEARVAAGLGAAGVLVVPSAGDSPALHDAVWRASALPMIAFDLYTRP